MKPSEKGLLTYFIGSMGINGFSSVLETWNGKVQRFIDREYKDTDLLMGEKFGIFVASTICGPWRLPFKALDWMNKVDIYFKGHNQSDYGYEKKKSIHDYL